MSSVVQFPSQKQRADAFTREKMRWLDTMVEDRQISADAFRLAYVLVSKYLSRRRGYAFPSQEQLGADLGITDRQVRRHLSKLIEAGYIRQKKGGTGRANEYRMVVPTGRLASGEENLTGHLRAADRTSEGRLTGRLASYQPSDEPSENPLIGRPTAGQPYDGCSTLDDSRGSPLDEAPPIPSEESESEPSRVGDLVDVDGDTHELEYRQEDGRWRARSLATGEFRSITFGSDGGVLADEADEIPF